MQAIMEFTGERYVPGTQGLEELYVEHMSRYVFASGLAPGRRVIDVGCGCGYGAHHLALAGAEHVIGIDNSPEAVGFARSNYRHPNLDFAVMDGHNLAVRPQVQLATCFEAIEHVADAPRLLREVKRILDGSGIFLVSTPNKATYAAGGEDGANPFHVTEYDLEEFAMLLTSEFAYVRIFGQFWSEGMILSPHPELLAGEAIGHVKLPDDGGGAGPQVPQGEPPYFIAACACRDVSEAVYSGLVPAVTHCLQPRYDRLKDHLRRLEAEFDERGRWAQRLDEDNRKKDETIACLKGELEQLRTEFDARGTWAKGLDDKIGVLEERLGELVLENETLRQARAAGGDHPDRKELKWMPGR
jgi:SAM-dependent methyltransferase